MKMVFINSELYTAARSLTATNGEFVMATICDKFSSLRRAY
jgi:hypothetical protein